MKFFLDVGGTKIDVFCSNENNNGKSNLLSFEKNLIYLKKFKTNNFDFEFQIKQILKQLSLNINDDLYFAMPGTISKKGILTLTNIDYSSNFTKFLRTNFNFNEVFILNDADAFALAVNEMNPFKKIVLGLIFGTGVGLGLVYHNILIQNDKGSFGEIGKLFEDSFSGRTEENILKSKGLTYELIENPKYIQKNKLKIQELFSEEFYNFKKIINELDVFYTPDFVGFTGSFCKFIELLINVYDYSMPFSYEFYDSKKIVDGLLLLSQFKN